MVRLCYLLMMWLSVVFVLIESGLSELLFMYSLFLGMKKWLWRFESGFVVFILWVVLMVGLLELVICDLKCLCDK